MNYRATLQEWRGALDMYEAAQMGYTPGTMPTEIKIARMVVEVIIPGLKAMLSSLDETSGGWTTGRNRISEKIGLAFAAGEPLAGYDPHDWVVWGQMLAWFNAFLATPQTVTYPDGATEEMTPLSVINTDFVKIEV